MKKCICESKVSMRSEEGEVLSIIKTPNYSCPVCFPEDNCEHKWKSGGINNKYFVEFCEKCGKIKIEAL